MVDTSVESEAWMASILKKAIEKGINLPNVRREERGFYFELF